MIRIYCDALCEPNPSGTIAWAFAVTENKAVLEKSSGVLPANPKNSSNVGEYLAVGKALAWANQNSVRELEILSDSQLMINQVLGTYACKTPHLQAMLARVKELCASAGVNFRWIPREQNTVADALSKKAYHEATGKVAPERARPEAKPDTGTGVPPTPKTGSPSPTAGIAPGALIQAGTLEAAMARISATPAYEWTSAWWRLGMIIVQNGAQAYQAKGPDALEPAGLELLGCAGLSQKGVWDWIGVDLDIGDHGTKSYANLDEAIADARRAREALKGRLEIRLSKSGNGVHLKNVPTTPMDAKDGPAFAKKFATALKLKADATPLGRQCFWHWAKTPGSNGFKLIEPHLFG
jgi:ribonuclease HI